MLSRTQQRRAVGELARELGGDVAQALRIEVSLDERNHVRRETGEVLDQARLIDIVRVPLDGVSASS